MLIPETYEVLDAHRQRPSPMHPAMLRGLQQIRRPRGGGIAPSADSISASIPLCISVGKQLSGYDDQQLAGFSLKKLVKKIVKPVAHIGAAVLTGGASLAASAAMLNASAQRKAVAGQDAIVNAQNQASMGMTQENFDVEEYFRQDPWAKVHKQWKNDPWGHWLKYGSKDGRPFPYKKQAVVPTQPIAPIATPMQTVTQTAPAAAAVAQYLPQPTMPQYQPPTVITVPGAPAQQMMQAPSTQPPWLIPAGIAAVVALFALSRRGKS